MKVRIVTRHTTCLILAPGFVAGEVRELLEELKGLDSWPHVSITCYFVDPDSVATRGVETQGNNAWRGEIAQATDVKFVANQLQRAVEADENIRFFIMTIRAVSGYGGCEIPAIVVRQAPPAFV